MFFVCFLTFLCAFLLSFSLFGASKVLALRIGAIDYPNNRKAHATPTARLGGLSFFVSFSLLIFLFPMAKEIKIPLLAGGIAMFLVGFTDDYLKLSPFAKLIGQIFASLIYILLNQESSILANALALLWIVFITNATNLIDGLDMLASGIGLGQSLCLFVVALIFGFWDIALCFAVLFFAILGFLPHNFPQAKIFMGDCGSLFLGFVLGALSSKLIIESGSALCLIAVLLIFRLPSADTLQSFFRRLIKRKNPFAADKGHFHHLLLNIGFSKECSALALIFTSLVFGFLGVLLVVI